LIDIYDRIKKLETFVAELSRAGVIESLDYTAKTVEVKLDDNLIVTVQWPAEIGNNFTRWTPLRVGTQVSIFRHQGAEDQFSISGMFFSTEITSANNAEDIDEITFNDGTVISYNSTDSAMAITVKGKLNITTDGDTNITAIGKAIVNGSEVIVSDGAAGGVVCQSHLCAFTGSPHPQGSSTFKGPM
jgi:phage baseplate assembly protein V